MSKIILVDCDGVMLDYNKAFADCYEKTYNIKLKQVFPMAYTATREYGIDISKHKSYDNIYKDFEPLQIWKNMPALPGSINAINSLVEKGYDVRCLTSMPPKHEEERLENLQTLGFKINKVYAVDRKIAKLQGIENPKLEIIKQTRALAFIDDLLKNFVDCDNELFTKFYWLDHEHPEEDNPNIGYNREHVQRVTSLQEFCDIFPKLNKTIKIGN